ncbi:PDR/VanB family oxidoreductase [Nocardia cerradoensis]|uniref:Phenoxybenzoate dioxygenase subunit beta n=1 Tax=Nocardia cerradoensis TaxID=85688 RepID=A0A231GZ64_9NOCA|nr:PDR/VanB family oxidoreductase [Nocardia cerradoensis]OXR41909.1 Phenoxybenzoate dioxygenase subunit beta [Nocardia cerradoensis]
MREDRVPRRMRVIGKEVAAVGVVAVTLADPDGGPVPAWEPGAHIDLVLGDMTRQYSLCGDPSDRESLTVAVLLEPEGRGGSAYVHDKLEVGDVITIAGPRNAFGLSEAASYLFIAGGIGITPLLPMLRSVDARGVPWRLLYGGRTRTSMAFADDLAAAHPDRVDVRPQDECGLLDLDTALDGLGLGGAVYCCGPEPLLRAVETACGARDHLTLHVERFAPKAADPNAASDSFEVELARTGAVVTVGADESVLAALERSGVDAEFSCREGTCGTCEVAVLRGRPDHRDSVLTEDEQAADDAMMICVSRSHTPRLVIDL